MLRTVWSLAKIAAVLAGVVWIAEHPGTLEINWLDYTLEFHIGFFFVVLLVLLALSVFIFAFIKGVADIPKTMSRYKVMKAKDKGIEALGVGLSAVAAGDAKSAARQAARVKKYLSDENPLALFMEAQAARLRGDESVSSNAYLALMNDKSAGFMGIRGLLQGALDRGDYDSALELGYRALERYPKREWILNIVYDLEVYSRHWDKAGLILNRLEKIGAVALEDARSDRVAMLLAQALAFRRSDEERGSEERAYLKKLKKAYRLDPSFLPTVLWLSEAYIDRNKSRIALSMIEKAWKVCPHPELTRLWAKAYTPPKDDNSAVRVRWFQRLLDLDPRSVEGLQAMASVMIQEELWGDARRHLEEAERIRPNAHLYKLWASLEDKATGNQSAVAMWEDKAASAPRERVWICSETGRVYNAWMPVSDQGLFNTIIWDYPQGRRFSMPHLQNSCSIAGLIGSAL